MKTILTLWRQWRLRRAMEKHAYWKGRRESLIDQANASGGMLVAENSYFRGTLTRAAAKESQYAERVDFFLHNP